MTTATHRHRRSVQQRSGSGDWFGLAYRAWKRFSLAASPYLSRLGQAIRPAPEAMSRAELTAEVRVLRAQVAALRAGMVSFNAPGATPQAEVSRQGR